MNVLLRYKAGLTCILTWLVLFPGFLPGAKAADLIRDPTKPLVDLSGAGGFAGESVEEEEEKPLTLQSVVVKDHYTVAVINSQLVKVGQIIEGYELTTVTAYGAQLERDGKGLSLSLFNLKVRKTANE